MVQFDVKRIQKGTESFMVSFDFAKTPVTQIADYIIIAASKHNASDIHFDPREDGMMVRFRIDGDCQDYTFVPKAYEKNLTTRLKLLANMNITESRLPQDGAIKGNFGDQYLDMRVSSLPLNQGEKIVIRILDYTRSLQGVATLGFHPKNLEKIKRMMSLPNGIILTTGATGSGKSTTTYSILQGLNRPETNIITVEDPIEMNIEGINQVQVNAEIGMTFAAALRSILRQDPNIILIGEIRDSETAQIAVRASITGHLVLSTIHTNNALATVERLLDMDVERYLLSTALSGIISQRLAKMLCPECRYQRETTKYEKKVFKKFMKMDVKTIWDANPKGCEHCRKGYRGRIAFHEVLEIDETLRNALSDERMEKEDLAKMVYSHGTISMLQDALIKCLDGKTSFEEVYRNIEIENEDDDNYENEMESIEESAPKTEDTVEESDDLLESPSTGGSLGQTSSVVVPMAFTAASFSDAPTTTTEGKKEEKNSGVVPPQKVENSSQQTPSVTSNNTQPLTPVVPIVPTTSTPNVSGNTVPQTVGQAVRVPDAVAKTVNPVSNYVATQPTAAVNIPAKPLIPQINTATTNVQNQGIPAIPRLDSGKEEVKGTVQLPQVASNAQQQVSIPNKQQMPNPVTAAVPVTNFVSVPQVGMTPAQNQGIPAIPTGPSTHNTVTQQVRMAPVQIPNFRMANSITSTVPVPNNNAVANNQVPVAATSQNVVSQPINPVPATTNVVSQEFNSNQKPLLPTINTQ